MQNFKTYLQSFNLLSPEEVDHLYSLTSTRKFKKGVLEFCGIRPVKVTYLAPVKNSSLTARNKWLEKVKQLGSQIN